MGNEIGRSMDMELEHEEEEKKEVIEIESDEEEEDEIEEELEEMTSPTLSCWVGADGKKHQEIVVNIYDDLNGFKNRLEMIDPCSICYLPFSTHGNHRICCLPCGHLYGFSCIKKWLQTPSGGKCPQCNTPCTYKDVILLYASHASACQKTSTTRHFPFTKQGLIEFKEHERLRRIDAKKMHAEDCKRLVEVLGHQRVIAKQLIALATQLDDLSERAEELKHDDALRRQYNALNQRYYALRRRCDALGRRAVVLEQRADVLERWLSAYKPTLKLFNQMYKEHMAQQKNTEPSAAAPTCHKH